MLPRTNSNISKSILGILCDKEINSQQKKDLLEFKKIIEKNTISPSKKAAEKIYNIIGD